MFESLIIECPKRSTKTQSGWDVFFPYYAGYPESFARALLESAHLPSDAVVVDPWNGSGTTTFSASQLGLTSYGFDLNPVMIIVARARLLPPSEADSLEPLARETVKGVRADQRALLPDDPLQWWFDRSVAALIRALERRIRDQLLGSRTVTPEGTKLENISGLAATFYLALFSVCRQLATPYRSSNPTWLRRPKGKHDRISASRDDILAAFMASMKAMATALTERKKEIPSEQAPVDLKLADTTSTALAAGSIDMILTSPPYCTRIDYSAVTRIELAVLTPIVDVKMEDLGRRMTGSTRVPYHQIVADEAWGETCNGFLKGMKVHPSKASSGYYYKTHLDYFEKMARSLRNISVGVKTNGAVALVVQDSYYKEIHNDLPTIVVEMAAATGLQLRRRVDFQFKRSMVGINPYARTYRRATGAMESVLCFSKL